MPTDRPRIQVTVDDELAAALAAQPQAGRSKSQTIRDLALRGAQAIADERQERASAADLLLHILDGSDQFDLDAAAELHTARADRLP